MYIFLDWLLDQLVDGRFSRTNSRHVARPATERSPRVGAFLLKKQQYINLSIFLIDFVVSSLSWLHFGLRLALKACLRAMVLIFLVDMSKLLVGCLSSLERYCGTYSRTHVYIICCQHFFFMCSLLGELRSCRHTCGLHFRLY